MSDTQTTVCEEVECCRTCCALRFDSGDDVANCEEGCEGPRVRCFNDACATGEAFLAGDPDDGQCCLVLSNSDVLVVGEGDVEVDQCIDFFPTFVPSAVPTDVVPSFSPTGFPSSVPTQLPSVFEESLSPTTVPTPAVITLAPLSQTTSSSNDDDSTDSAMIGMIGGLFAFCLLASLFLARSYRVKNKQQKYASSRILEAQPMSFEEIQDAELDEAINAPSVTASKVDMDQVFAPSASYRSKPKDPPKPDPASSTEGHLSIDSIL